MGFTGGAYYNENIELTEYTEDTKTIPHVKPDLTQMFEALTLVVQSMDRSVMYIPQGDIMALFVQSFFTRMNLQSMRRKPGSKSRTPNEIDGDILKTSRGSYLNHDKIVSEYCKSINKYASQENGMVTPKTEIVYQKDVLGKTDKDPFLHEITEMANSDNTCITTSLAGDKNSFLDFTLSDHTITGAMSSIMNVLISAAYSGELEN